MSRVFQIPENINGRSVSDQTYNTPQSAASEGTNGQDDQSKFEANMVSRLQNHILHLPTIFFMRRVLQMPENTTI